MSRRDLVTVALGVLSFAALSLYSARNLRVSTDITHFLPSSGNRRLAQLSRELTQSSGTRMMILSIQGPTIEEALNGAEDLALALRANPEVASCRSGPAVNFAQSVYELIFPHRFQLYSDHPKTEIPRLLSDAGLSAAAARLKAQLTLPTAPLVEKLAPSDPLLLFPAIVKRLSEAGDRSLQVVDGQFVTADREHAIIFLETRHSAFDGAAQGPFLSSLSQAFARINRAHGGALKLEESGVNRFAVDSERIIKNDIRRISSISTLSVVLLFLLLFRSIRVLLLSFVPLFYGLAAATAASVFLFGEVHGLTLAFGATLIGVCVDYPIYFLNHHALDPDSAGPRGSLHRISGALVLGALTSIAGFAGLAWTSFPGMRELAVFATVGIVAALLATIFFLPALSVRSPKPVLLHQTLAAFFGRAVTIVIDRRSVAFSLAFLALLICFIGLPRVKWSDNLSALSRPNAKLLAEDERVRAEVSRMDAGRLVVATGATAAEAMDRNDEVYQQLLKAKEEGDLEDFASLHPLLFSPELQQANLEAFRSSPDLAERLSAAFAKQGFRPTAFTPFVNDLRTAPAVPLSLDAVLHSPLGEIARPFTISSGTGAGVISLVRGVRHPLALKRRVERVPGAIYFDQSAFLAQAYRRYRRRTMQLLTLGVLIMFAVVFAKYRRWRPTLAAGLPALLAATSTLAVLGLLGVTANLLHLIALVLVLSAGEDYAIFLLASVRAPARLRASAISVVLCGLSAVLGFGLLGLSRMPALHALGLTTSIGILLALILAPTALVLAPEGSP